MSDSARDPAMLAAARLEAAVEVLATVLQAKLARPDARDTDAPGEEPHGETHAAPADMVPRVEVAAIAERLEATVARLRAALPDELRVHVGES